MPTVAEHMHCNHPNGKQRPNPVLRNRVRGLLFFHRPELATASATTAFAIRLLIGFYAGHRIAGLRHRRPY